MGQQPWTIDVYRAAAGEKLVQVFIAGLGERDKDEAFALIKLLEGQGNALKRPHWGALGGGLSSPLVRNDPLLLSKSGPPKIRAWH